MWALPLGRDRGFSPGACYARFCAETCIVLTSPLGPRRSGRLLRALAPYPGKIERVARQGLALAQDIDVVRDAVGPTLGVLGVVEPVQELVPLAARERLEELLRWGVLIKCGLQIVWNRCLALRCVGVVESSVGRRGLELRETGRLHAAVGDQPSSALTVDRRPFAARSSRREAPSEEVLVVAGQLPIGPAEADRLLDRLGLRDCRRRRTLLWRS